VKDAAQVRYELVACPELSRAQRDLMFQLLDQHFRGITPEQFTRDLAEKTLAMLLFRGEAMVGFSTLLGYASACDGKPLNVIYSGDTIVKPDAWGSTALPRAWVAGVNAVRAMLPKQRCYWLLLTSGFRTYRFLPVFWREFFPRFDLPTPSGAATVLHQLAGQRFGKQFDSGTGIVRFAKPQRLRSGGEFLAPGRERDPHVAFFLSRNPGHAAGDELVCLTEISPANLTRAGVRMSSNSNERARHHC
jgi:hypothetical protein